MHKRSCIWKPFGSKRINECQNCWNLQISTFILLFHHFEPNGVRKKSFLVRSEILGQLLKGDLRPKLHSYFMADFCWFYGYRALYKVLWRLDQVARNYKITNFEFSKSDVILVDVQKVSPLVFSGFLLVVWRKNVLLSFMWSLTIFRELARLRSFEWLDCIST